MPPQIETSAADRWLDTPQFAAMMESEFPEDASEWLDPVSRRQFLTVMGASVALAGAVGCNPSLKPAASRQVVPYVNQPDQVLAGTSLFFATAYPQQSGVGLGLLVRQTMGRPIKVEGNPNHPGSLGSTDLTGQASLLGLYDPDRAKGAKHEGRPGTFDAFVSGVKGLLDAQLPKQGEGVRFLTEPTTSPTHVALMDEFLKRYPKAKWVQYEPVHRENARQAVAAAFGAPANAVYRLGKAKVALALDCDFLGSGVGHVRHARDFMHNRKARTAPEAIKRGEGVALDDMNRLYAVESMLTPTGGVADHRLAVKPSQVLDFAKALAAKLGVAGVQAPTLPAEAQAWVDPVAADLTAAKGAAVVLVGDEQPAAVHYLALAINERLGAVGTTVTFTEPLETRPTGLADLKALADEMRAGKVELLFLFGGNPAYDAPADFDFAGALKAMKGTKVRLSPYEDETAFDGECQWFLNATHYLETWGDVRGHDGTVTVQQPLIAPLYSGKSAIEVLATLLSSGVSAPLELVQATWRKHYDGTVKGTDFQGWWERALRDGVVPGTALPEKKVAAVKPAAEVLADKAFAVAAPKPGLEVQFKPDPTVYDGRYANNGWLQECPKPITELTWDNAAIVSPATADRLGLTNTFAWTAGERGRMIADLAKLTVNGRAIERIAVFIQPMHADDAVTLHLGYGRTRAGRVGTGTEAGARGQGFDTYALRTSDATGIGSGAELTKAGDTFFLACLQGQYLMEGRKPARQATVAQFVADPEFAQVPPATAAEYKELRQITPGTVEDMKRLGMEHPYPPERPHDHSDPNHTHDHDKGVGHAEHEPHDKRVIPLTLYPEYPTKVNGQEAVKAYRRWGMAIDLGACIGCNSCVMACVAENNTPVLGKYEASRGRAMHWIRVDRYFSMPGEGTQSDELGAAEIPASVRAERLKQSNRIRAHFQPVPCQQCEKAPCELVCPVGATVHSADGLNDMVYNRCVGTRYCSNNCPYKVRRFNFIQYADWTTDSLKLLNNPEVSVRQRGVMEKCTYCVQRIRNAEIDAEREFDKRLAAGVVDKFGRPKIVDGEVVTSCQAACPTAAIQFGDLNDNESAVLRAKGELHNYGLLAELAVMPRTSYLAAIRNPNPAMPKGA